MTKKGFPWFYPSGKKVSPEIRKKYLAELKKSRSPYKSRKGMVGIDMARRRTRRRISRAARRYRKRGAGSFNIKNLALPIGVATVAEPIVDSYANQLPIPSVMGMEADDMVKVAIGYYFGKKGGLMGNTAKMLGIFGLRNLIAQVTKNVLAQNQSAFVTTNGQGFG